MSVFQLSYGTADNVVNILRRALVQDPLFQPDGTKKSRSAEHLVMNAWGFQMRDFPIAVVTGVPGSNRRAGIGDLVRPFHGVALAEDPDAVQTAALRTFTVPLIVIPETPVQVRHVGDPETDPKGPFEVLVQRKTVLSQDINFIEIAGTAVGPEATFPLKDWEASTKDFATGQVYGGWYDLNLELTVGARNTTTRDLVADTIWSLLWFTKKRELRKKGIVVQDIRHAGFREADYGANKIFYSKFIVSVATEFEAIAQYTETVGDVTVEGTATNTL